MNEADTAVPRPSFLAEFWDAGLPANGGDRRRRRLRSSSLFIASYVGAFHEPTPHDVPIGVVAPPSIAHRTIAKLDAAAGHPVQAQNVPRVVTPPRPPSVPTSIAGAIMIDPASSTDARLLVLRPVAVPLWRRDRRSSPIRTEAVDRRTVRVEDLVPLQPGDYRCLSGFSSSSVGSSSGSWSRRCSESPPAPVRPPHAGR